MDDIAKAFAEYVALLDNLTWLRENGNLPANTDIGMLAFQGAIARSSPVVIAAFVASQELIHAHKAEVGSQSARRRAPASDVEIAQYEARQEAERALYARAKALASERVC